MTDWYGHKEMPLKGADRIAKGKDFVPFNTVTINSNLSNFLNSKAIIFSLFKTIICCILICLTAQKFVSKVATLCGKTAF